MNAGNRTTAVAGAFRPGQTFMGMQVIEVPTFPDGIALVSHDKLHAVTWTQDHVIMVWRRDRIDAEWVLGR